MANRRAPISKGKHLASVNFTKELIEWLDQIQQETGMNRSSIVCLMLQDYKNSGRTISVSVQ